MIRKKIPLRTSIKFRNPLKLNATRCIQKVKDFSLPDYQFVQNYIASFSFNKRKKSFRGEFLTKFGAVIDHLHIKILLKLLVKTLLQRILSLIT